VVLTNKTTLKSLFAANTAPSFAMKAKHRLIYWVSAIPEGISAHTKKAIHPHGKNDFFCQQC
jgi:hypothetical protein